MKKYQIISITTFIISFIILYYLFLLFFYVIPQGYDFPIIVMIGFALIIIGFFYFFIKLIDSDNKIYTFHYKGISETSLKVILIILMLITFFIPPITFSEIIIDWNQISFLNYLRGIIYIIGCAFIPGSCIFNILFPKSSLHEKFNIEPFFIKIVFYPLISFTFLGSTTLILDQIGLSRGNFSIVLLIIIIVLFFLDLLFQKHYGKRVRFTNECEMKISKFTIFILFITLSIIIISFGIQLRVNYILTIDHYRSINYSNFIGLQETHPYDKFYTYAIHWSYISFGLASLTSIPVVNINVMLFPFIYLFMSSLYLFLKVFLKDIKEKYAVLATLLAITFSSLFDIFHSYRPRERISHFALNSILNFQYKGFALILLIASMVLFMSLIKHQKSQEVNEYLKREAILITILSAFLLLQSIMIYFLPSIPAISLILILIIFAKKKDVVIKYYLLFMILLISFFIFFDTITNFFFSFRIVLALNGFFNLNLFFQGLPFSFMILFNAILVYSLLIGFLIINLFICTFYKKNYFKKVKITKKFSLNSKYIFLAILIIFTELLILDIIFNFFGTLHESLYSAFILHLLFLNIGFVGISGMYLSYYSYKKNRQIFYISLIWFIFLFSLSLIVLFIKWFQYPSLGPHKLDYWDYVMLIYWFTRIWYYSIIPISIFCSIGLIKLMKYLSSKFLKKRFKKFLTLQSKLLIVAIFVISALSNTIIAGISHYNSGYRINDEEAQVIGWISKNTPQKSKILVDRGFLYQLIDDITLRSSYMIDYEIEQALFNYSAMNVSKEIDDNCDIELLDELDDHKNVIEISDQNSNGRGSILIKSNKSQQFGEIQFYIKTSDKSKLFWINLRSPEDITVISFGIYSNAFHLYNGIIYQKLMDIENDVWYQINLMFECTNGNYSGLGEYQWKAIINGTNFGEFNFMNKKLIKNFYLSTSDLHSDYTIYITDFNFSWVPMLKLEYSIFTYLIVFDHLRYNNITYFILSEEETKYNKNVESYIDIKGDLIPKFYKNKLYEYKYLSLYSTN